MQDLAVAESSEASRPKARLNIGWTSLEDLLSGSSRRSIGAEDDGATIELELDELRRPDVAFVGEASLDALHEGAIHRLFTGQVERVVIDGDRATITLGGGAVPLQEARMGGLVIGDGSDGIEMVANLLRAYGMRPEKMRLEGYNPGPREPFLVAVPVSGLALSRDYSAAGVTFTATNPALLGMPQTDDPTVRKYLGAEAWAYATVEADTVFDAEVLGLATLDLGIAIVRALGSYRFPILGASVREFDRQHVRARLSAVDVVFVGSLVSKRRWLRVTTDPLKLPQLPLDKVGAAEVPQSPGEQEIDPDLSRAIREWRAAMDARDDFARTTRLWRAVECYSKRAPRTRHFTDEERDAALTAALAAADWNDDQAARIRATLGGVNNPPLLTKFKAAIARDAVNVTEDQFQAVAATRTFRNSIEHGRTLTPLQQESLDCALAVVNKVLLGALLRPSSS